MKSSWISKTDPEHHPVRFLASLWQQQMKVNFGMAERPLTSREYGQLKALRLHMGDLTRELIEWIVDPVNWWHFCQQVRAGWKTPFVPDYPHIGFLLGRRGVALGIMRSKLSNCSAGVEFVKKLDQREYEETKTLALVFAEGKPERLAKIENSKTLTDIQRVFIEIVDESTVASNIASVTVKS